MVAVDWPLARKEKEARLVHLFQCELEHTEAQRRSLSSQLTFLRRHVSQLLPRATTPTCAWTPPHISTPRRMIAAAAAPVPPRIAPMPPRRRWSRGQPRWANDVGATGTYRFGLQVPEQSHQMVPTRSILGMALVMCLVVAVITRQGLSSEDHEVLQEQAEHSSHHLLYNEAWATNAFWRNTFIDSKVKQVTQTLDTDACSTFAAAPTEIRSSLPPQTSVPALSTEENHAYRRHLSVEQSNGHGGVATKHGIAMDEQETTEHFEWHPETQHEMQLTHPIAQPVVIDSLLHLSIAFTVGLVLILGLLQSWRPVAQQLVPQMLVPQRHVQATDPVGQGMNGLADVDIAATIGIEAPKVMKAPRERSRWAVSALAVPVKRQPDDSSAPPKSAWGTSDSDKENLINDVFDTPKKRKRCRTTTPEPPKLYKARKMYLASVGEREVNPIENGPHPYPFKSKRLREVAECEVARLVASAADVEEALAADYQRRLQCGYARVSKRGASGGS